MSGLIELAGERQEELLREAVSRETAISLSCRLENGWVTLQSRFLGIDRSSGDLVIASPTGPDHLMPDFVEGQRIGAAFRRAQRKCVFETQVVGRCLYSVARADDVSALRLLWPASAYELQRRLYYRTPVPPDVNIPVEVWPWQPGTGDSWYGRVIRGQLQDLSAGGLSLVISREDNPHWSADTPVGCAFIAAQQGQRLELYGHTRYLSPPAAGELRLGVQFVGLDAAEQTRPTLEQILDLTSRFQQIEMSRVARA